MRTDDFRYQLPDDAIAQEPIEPRDAARVLDTRDLTDHGFVDLPSLLGPGDLVVLNRTRVHAARVAATKTTGGAVEILFLRPRGDDTWQAMVRPARRTRRGTTLQIGSIELQVVSDPTDGIVLVQGDVAAAMEHAGRTPLPPYIHGELADPERYQTVYGDRSGSAAAPTAGLHFTPGVFDGLAAAGVEVTHVDLQIGLDTFRPISADQLAGHRMHSERASVTEEAVSAIEQTRTSGGRVAAVGTTVVRSLETAARSGSLRPFEGDTDLFITPGFPFRVVDLLVTNFHLPGSSLVVLVAAFMGERWREAYDTALDRGYRFLSFGDAMLAERA